METCQSGPMERFAKPYSRRFKSGRLLQISIKEIHDTVHSGDIGYSLPTYSRRSDTFTIYIKYLFLELSSAEFKDSVDLVIKDDLSNPEFVVTKILPNGFYALLI